MFIPEFCGEKVSNFLDADFYLQSRWQKSVIQTTPFPALGCFTTKTIPSTRETEDEGGRCLRRHLVLYEIHVYEDKIFFPG